MANRARGSVAAELQRERVPLPVRPTTFASAVWRTIRPPLVWDSSATRTSPLKRPSLIHR